jgi:hypothetical protein
MSALNTMNENVAGGKWQAAGGGWQVANAVS